MRRPLLFAGTFIGVLAPTVILARSPERLAAAARSDAGQWFASMASQGRRVTPAPTVDPGMRVGRFLPSADAPDTAAIRTACSTFVTPLPPVASGHFERDELLVTSREAALSLGVPPFAQLAVNGGAQLVLRAKYVEESSVGYEIADPDRFEACCREAPGRCTPWMVGGYVAGKEGEVAYASSTSLQAGAKGVSTSVVGDGSWKSSRDWETAVRWTEPVYAFYLVVENPWKGGAAALGLVAAASCDDPAVTWDTIPPQDAYGDYFVGTSTWTFDEAAAAAQARASARAQALEAAGSLVASSFETRTTTASSAGGTTSAMSAEQTTSGLVAGVKDRAQCKAVRPNPAGGEEVQVRVLMVLPR